MEDKVLAILKNNAIENNNYLTISRADLMNVVSDIVRLMQEVESQAMQPDRIKTFFVK